MKARIQNWRSCIPKAIFSIIMALLVVMYVIIIIGIPFLTVYGIGYFVSQLFVFDSTNNVFNPHICGMLSTAIAILVVIVIYAIKKIVEAYKNKKIASSLKCR